MSWTNQWNAIEPQPAPEPIRPTRGSKEPSAFGSMLAALRLARNLSQTRLGEKAQFDHSYVSRLESGTRTPSWDAVQRLATVLGLGVDDHNRLLAAAGFLPDDLTGLIDPQAVEIQRVLIAVKGTEKEADIRAVLRLIVSQAA